MTEVKTGDGAEAVAAFAWPGDWADVATVFAGGAAVATVGVGIWALRFAREQIQAAREQVDASNKLAQLTHAREVWRDYLKMAVDYPLLALGDGRPERKTAAESEQYEWFVSYMLWACEEVLQAFDDEAWREIVDTQLGYHSDYLTTAFAQRGYADHYKGPFREVIAARFPGIFDQK